MDTVIDLETLVQREVESYAAAGWKMTDYQVSDTSRHVYTVIGVPDHPREEQPHIAVMARVVDGTVIIEADITDRPLADELMRAGVPREKIVLAYRGETVAKTNGSE